MSPNPSSCCARMVRPVSLSFGRSDGISRGRSIGGCAGQVNLSLVVLPGAVPVARLQQRDRSVDAEAADCPDPAPPPGHARRWHRRTGLRPSAPCRGSTNSPRRRGSARRRVENCRWRRGTGLLRPRQTHQMVAAAVSGPSARVFSASAGWPVSSRNSAKPSRRRSSAGSDRRQARNWRATSGRGSGGCQPREVEAGMIRVRPWRRRPASGSGRPGHPRPSRRWRGRAPARRCGSAGSSATAARAAVSASSHAPDGQAAASRRPESQVDAIAGVSTESVRMTGEG